MFVASSTVEFKDERKRLGTIVGGLNVGLLARDEYLDFIICEDLSNKIVKGGKQSEYNRELETADLVIVLAGRKLGKYTLEELDLALATRDAHGSPRVVAFLKRCEPAGELGEGDLSIEALLDLLESRGVETRWFSDMAELERAFSEDDLIATLL